MKNKYLFSIFFLVCLFLVPSFISAQEVKNALLIANNEYGGNVPSLDKPVAEARDLRRALASIGFNVTIVENANREKMEDVLFSFKEKCKKEGGIAFFHYGGHAVQIDGVNYLLPAKTSLDSIEQVRGKCVNVENLMDNMQGDANIVVLDSCRNNPFKSGTRGVAKRGLAPINNRRENSIIIYSADSNQEAQDGLFTPILTRYITKKNITIIDMLMEVRREVMNQSDNDQQPADYNKLIGKVYLAGKDFGFASKTLNGFLDVSTYTPVSIVIDNEYAGEIEGFSQKRFEIPSGNHRLKIKYKDGVSENSNILIKSENIAKLELKYLSKEQVRLSVEFASKYLKGLNGVYKDYKQAFEYAKIAADAHDNEGEYIVGYCFELGFGITKNESEAFKWYKKAAENGNGNAMWKMGIFYHYGKGNINKDIKEAKKWYEKATKANCSEEGTKNARNALNEINEMLTAKDDMGNVSVSRWSNDFCSLEVNFGYNVSHFTTKNKELAFNSHGFTLGLTEARFHLEDGFDIKIRTDYTLCVKKFTTETIKYNEFNFIVGQFGYKYKWFAFHFGLAPSFQWETVTTFNFITTVSNFIFGFKFPTDLEFSIYDRCILYVEYGPKISVTGSKDLIPLIQHSFNIGIQIKIIDYYM
ncbi:MAG: caspase family protein [Treponema sp.]